VLTRQGYYYGAYSVQQFLWADSDHPGKGWGFFFLAGRVPEGPSTGQNGPITTLLRPIILNFNRLSGRKTRGARSYSILLSRNPRY